MSNYSSYISSCANIDDIVEICHQHLLDAYKHRPWTYPDLKLKHGTDLLMSDTALDCYMSAYGEMHIGKCRAAMTNFPFNELNGSIEIVDWGCGQGIGSGSIVDILKQRDLLQWVKRITLIEPSTKALSRAVCNLTVLTENRIEINPINKYLPSSDEGGLLSIERLNYTYSNIIHVFSNILDVKGIDLASIANMINGSEGKHFILCMGPKNSATYRRDQFCSLFGEQVYFSKIDSARYGRTQRTGHSYTCYTHCFTYNGNPIDDSHINDFQDPGLEVFNDYDLQLQIQNGTLSLLKARVAYRLQNILSDDDILYINPVINEVTVDFVIFRQNKGILLINVFEDDLNDCEYSKQDKEIITNTGAIFQSPIDSISSCMYSIKDGIEELLMGTVEDKNNYKYIKQVVVFAQNSINDVRFFWGSNFIDFVYLYGSEFLNEYAISKNFFRDIDIQGYNSLFDDAMKRRFANIISPSWHSYKEGRSGLEAVGPQKKLIISEDKHQKISGVAGSGKTFVLAARCINALKRTGGKVLVLTYNITLVNYLKFRLSEIREDFSWENIDIYHYHQFFRIRASEYKLKVSFGSYDDISFFDNIPEHERYSAIFVDEVQDYTTEWLKIIMNNFLEPGGEFVVFGDPKQNIFKRPLDSNNDIRLGVITGEWNKQLASCVRFKNPWLSAFTSAFQKKFFPDAADDFTINSASTGNIFHGIKYLDYRGNNSNDIIVEKIIQIIRESNHDTQDFALIASSIQLLRDIDYQYRQKTGETTEITFVSEERLDNLKSLFGVVDDDMAQYRFSKVYDAADRLRKQKFTTDKRCLKISTIQSFKGWESPSIILIIGEDDNASFRMSPEVIYTALTRAREDIYIINLGNNQYDDFFRSQSN